MHNSKYMAAEYIINYVILCIQHELCNLGYLLILVRFQVRY